MEQKELMELVAAQSKKILRLEKELEDEIAGNEFWFLEFKRCEEEKINVQRQLKEQKDNTDAPKGNIKASSPV